jgi:hypothetical protein
LANLLRGTNLNEVKDLAESEGFRDLCNKLSLTEIMDACDMYLEKMPLFCQAMTKQKSTEISKMENHL